MSKLTALKAPPSILTSHPLLKSHPSCEKGVMCLTAQWQRYQWYRQSRCLQSPKECLPRCCGKNWSITQKHPRSFEHRWLQQHQTSNRCKFCPRFKLAPAEFWAAAVGQFPGGICAAGISLGHVNPGSPRSRFFCLSRNNSYWSDPRLWLQESTAQ